MMISIFWAIFFTTGLSFSVNVASQAPYLPIISIVFVFVANSVLLHFSGPLYINILSRLAFKFKRDSLMPLFWSSLLVWIGLFFYGFTTQIIEKGLSSAGNIFWLTLLVGSSTFFLHRGMFKKAKSIRNAIDGTSDVKLTTADFIEHVNALKKADSIQQLEDLSKNCLRALNLSVTDTGDSINLLVQELVKQNLLADANEISTIQLKLLETKDSESVFERI